MHPPFSAWRLTVRVYIYIYICRRSKLTLEPKRTHVRERAKAATRLSDRLIEFLQWLYTDIFFKVAPKDTSRNIVAKRVDGF